MFFRCCGRGLKASRAFWGYIVVQLSYIGPRREYFFWNKRASNGHLIDIRTSRCLLMVRVVLQHRHNHATLAHCHFMSSSGCCVFPSRFLRGPPRALWAAPNSAPTAETLLVLLRGFRKSGILAGGQLLGLCVRVLLSETANIAKSEIA